MVDVPERNIAPSGGAPATRELLLDAGERLFAERGIHGVSLREIGLAAGQRNNGATQYHFGDKTGLVIAIFERRSAEVNARRLELLDEAVAAGRTGVRDLVHAFVEPLAEQVQRANPYVRFLTRLQTDATIEVLLDSGEDVRAAAQRIRAMLREHLSSLPRPLFSSRWTLATRTAASALADYQTRAERGETRLLPFDVFVSELVDAITGLLLAPSAIAAVGGR